MIAGFNLFLITHVVSEWLEASLTAKRKNGFNDVSLDLNEGADDCHKTENRAEPSVSQLLGIDGLNFRLPPSLEQQTLLIRDGEKSLRKRSSVGLTYLWKHPLGCPRASMQHIPEVAPRHTSATTLKFGGRCSFYSSHSPAVAEIW